MATPAKRLPTVQPAPWYQECAWIAPPRFSGFVVTDDATNINNLSNHQISYHIISHHIISYHIISSKLDLSLQFFDDERNCDMHYIVIETKQK